MENISFTIASNAQTMEFPANPVQLVEWWTTSDDTNTDGTVASMSVVVADGKFGSLRIYPDGVLYYVKASDFTKKISESDEKTEEFVIVKRNASEVLETKSVTISFEGEAPVAGLYNVDSAEKLFNALGKSDVAVINITAPFTISEYKVVDLKGATINGNNHKISFTQEGKGITFMNAGKLVDVNVEKTTATPDKWTSGYNIQLYKGDFEVDNLTSIGNNAALLVNSSNVQLNGTTTLGNQNFGGIEVSKSSNAGSKPSTLTINGTIVDPTETEATPAVWKVNDGSNIVGYTFAAAKNVDDKTHYYIKQIYPEIGEGEVEI